MAIIRWCGAQNERVQQKHLISGSVLAGSTVLTKNKQRELSCAQLHEHLFKEAFKSAWSFMRKHEKGVTEASKLACQRLLNADQPVPENTIFDANLWESALESIGSRSKAKIFHDLTQLIVPSAQGLALTNPELQHLIESLDEVWDSSIPFIGSRPQPGISVGFKKEAFGEKRLMKFAPYIGDVASGDTSSFMATFYLYFPFLTCEVKCSTWALDIADQQNTHSMTLAVRAVTELFQ